MSIDYLNFFFLSFSIHPKRKKNLVIKTRIPWLYLTVLRCSFAHAEVRTRRMPMGARVVFPILPSYRRASLTHLECPPPPVRGPPAKSLKFCRTRFQYFAEDFFVVHESSVVLHSVFGTRGDAVIFYYIS